MWFNKVITRVRNLVLRVPSKHKLARLFEQDEGTIPNPVKRIKSGCSNADDPRYSITPEDLRMAVDEADRFVAERPIIVEAVKVIDPEYQPYEREAVQERPKFKCKCKKDGCCDK